MLYQGDCFNLQGCEVIGYKKEKHIKLNFRDREKDVFEEGYSTFHIIKPKFSIGQLVVWDSVEGSFGRKVGEGVIKEFNGTLYLVTINKDRNRFRWFREADLTEYLEI